VSGIEAVRKIVETEAQAKRIVEEANSKARETLARASDEARGIRQTAAADAERRRIQILQETRDKAESDARNSDAETDALLEDYKKLFESKKNTAAAKAVELILGG